MRNRTLLVLLEYWNSLAYLSSIQATLCKSPKKVSESGSIFEGLLLPEGLNIYATTASNAEKSSCPGEEPYKFLKHVLQLKILINDPIKPYRNLVSRI